MKRWKIHFLQQQSNVEIGYLMWLCIQWGIWSGLCFVSLLITVLFSSRITILSVAVFSFLMGMLMAATRVFVDHCTLCPARSTEEAYRVVQSSLLIWMLFVIGACFFVSHYNSFFLFFCMIWISIYAAYLHIRAGRKALKPARDEMLPSTFRMEEDSPERDAIRAIDEIIANRKIDFLQRMQKSGAGRAEMIKQASNEFL